MPLARIVARAELPSRFGRFTIVGFENEIDHLEHIALVRGEVDGAQSVPVRVHSECLTGDALGSLRCDCRDQLELALTQLGRQSRGVLLYLRQEGRGIGLINKLRAYALQDHGLDTVEANRHLGFDDDLRSYGAAAAMLQALGVRSIELYTNNPRKIEGLEREGVVIVGRSALECEPNPFNRFYLETKHKKSGHLLEFLDDRPLRLAR
jgi:GTP cyclohydrolase II